VKYVILIWLTIINLLWVFPISAGDKYQNHLEKWYWLVSEGKWDEAQKLEKNINPQDILWFKEKNKTEELKKTLNEMTVKNDKFADDWMKIAYIQKRLGKNDEMKESIEKAYKLDPIRKDIEKIYFSSAF